MSRIYLCGKMSGEPEFAYPKFYAAAKAWRTLGWDVLDPAERFEGRTDLPYAVYLNHSMIDVIACDAVAVLPGWEASPGATLEVLYARTVGKPVYLAQYPAGSGSSGLRPAAGGVFPPSRQLLTDSPAVVGVSGGKCPSCGPDGCGCGADDGAAEDVQANGVAGSPGLVGGPSGLHAGGGEGAGAGSVDPTTAICRRCTRPMMEHPPMGSAIDQFACEEFLP